jgi:uncharacterized protein YuzE
MKVTYDAALDILRLLFSDTPIAESDEDKPGVILDYGEDGRIVGMEILDASKQMTSPNHVELVIIGDEHSTSLG